MPSQGRYPLKSISLGVLDLQTKYRPWIPEIAQQEGMLIMVGIFSRIGRSTHYGPNGATALDTGMAADDYVSNCDVEET